MRYRNKKMVIGMVLAVYAMTFSGCSSSSPDVAWNKALIEQKAPVRLVKDTSYTKGDRYIEGWAGKTSVGTVSENYKAFVFELTQKNCGYGESEFIEVRIVSQKENSLEEVWLFNDLDSYRDDKVSGLTVYSVYNPKSNSTDTNFFGSCHTGKGTSFTFD